MRILVLFYLIFEHFANEIWSTVSDTFVSPEVYQKICIWKWVLLSIHVCFHVSIFPFLFEKRNREQKSLLFLSTTYPNMKQHFDYTSYQIHIFTNALRHHDHRLARRFVRNNNVDLTENSGNSKNDKEKLRDTRKHRKFKEAFRFLLVWRSNNPFSISRIKLISFFRHSNAWRISLLRSSGRSFALSSRNK